MQEILNNIEEKSKAVFGEIDDKFNLKYKMLENMDSSSLVYSS